MNSLIQLRIIMLYFSMTIIFQLSWTQMPSIDWQKTIGGSGDDYVNFGKIFTLNDGHYLIVGTTTSSDGDFADAGNQGGYDGYAAKFTEAGTILWLNTYGGSGDDILNAVVEEVDGGLSIAGFTSSDDGDVSGNHGFLDGWIIRLDSEGNLLSQQCYGGSGFDVIRGMVKTNGDQYVFAGVSDSNDGDVSGNHGSDDAWVAKIGNHGNLIWSKSFGGSSYEYISGIFQTDQGKFIIAGTTGSTDGIMSSNHGGDDGFAIQLNQAGALKWSKCFGGSSLDVTQYGIEKASDGNLILPMLTLSTDGDAVENHGSFDMLVLKINSSSGATIWSHCYGTALDEGAFGALALPEGELILLGVAATDGSIDATYDALAVKVDEDGNQIWTKTFGGSDFDDAEDGVVTDDGGFLLMCHTASYDGDVTNQHGPFDVWLVKLNEEGERIQIPSLHLSPVFELTASPNPCSTNTSISFNLPQTGNIHLSIFSVNGELVQTIIEGEIEKGQYQYDWSPSNVQPGLYIIQLETRSFTEQSMLMITR